MAIGLAKMMNLDFPINFSSPYKSKNIIQFWRRWHMSLSRFLRDYLYIALGGNRKGALHRQINLMITMLLGGLWHGAAWTFMLWGGLHGAALMINHGWQALERRLGGRTLLPRPAAHVLTIMCVVATWVAFRADSFGAAMAMWKAMIGLNGFALPETLTSVMGIAGLPADHFLCRDAGPALALIAGLWAIVFGLPNTQEILTGNGLQVLLRQRCVPSWLWPVVMGAIMGIAQAVALSQTASEFLYFRF